MASIKDFYNDIKSKKKSVKNNELSKLYQRPVKENTSGSGFKVFIHAFI